MVLNDTFVRLPLNWPGAIYRIASGVSFYTVVT
jgi:hypothetical protein